MKLIHRINSWQFLRRASGLLTLTFLLQVIGHFPAVALDAPNAPGFRNAQVKIIADNDFAVFMGNDQEITRLFYQNEVSWYAQVDAIQTLDVYPLAGETYLYVVAMGGNGGYNEPDTADPPNPFLGGQEDWAGVINGKSIFTYPGAQVLTGRSVINSTYDISYLGYLLVHKYFPNWDSSSGEIANGPYSIDSATVNSAISNGIWSSADLTVPENVPIRRFLRTDCTVSCRVLESGITARGWDFPDASAVIFRYPLSQAQLPVTAGDKQVVVDWDAPAGGGAVATYAVDYKESSEPDSAYKSFSIVSASTTIETVTGLTNGTSYTFRVTARNDTGSASSVSRAVTPTGTPSQPLNLSYTAGAGSVDISFTEPENNGGLAVANYAYSLNNGDTWTVRSPVSITSPLTISGLTDGINYSIKIRAINPFGMGTPSATLIAKPGLTANRTITYVAGTLDTVTGLPSGGTYLAGETFTVGAGPTRRGFTFTGWKEGANSYQPGNIFTVGASNASLTAQWTQDSLLGTTASDRSRVLTWNISANQSIDATVSGGMNNTVRVEIPANAFDPGTEVIFWRLLNDNVAKSKIDSSNSYLVNLAISWSIGDDITTPKTVALANTPIRLTITNDSIKAGATAWQIVGDSVKVIGTASTNGVLQLNFTEDPVIAAANVASPPVFSSPISTADGFTVSITNYDEVYTWETPTVNSGSVAITSTSGSNRLLTVTGLSAGASATVTQTNSLSGVANSSRTSTVIGSANLPAGLIPIFDSPISTSDGFSVNITNYDGSYNWATPVVNSGTVNVTSTSGNIRTLTVSGIASGSSATITQTTSRSGYLNGSGTATGSATASAKISVVTPEVTSFQPPSSINVIQAPKISQTPHAYICTLGEYVFLRNGFSKETPKFASQTFFLLQDGKVIESKASSAVSVTVDKGNSRINSIFSCRIEVEQESIRSSFSSIDNSVIKDAQIAMKNTLKNLEEEYYLARAAAYAKKNLELSRLKNSKISAASKDISRIKSVLALRNYSKSLKVALLKWKEDLKVAATNRENGKIAAEIEYLRRLESLGISISAK